MSALDQPTRVVDTGSSPAAAEAGQAVAPAGGLRHGFSSLRHRDFAVFWTAAVISNTGTWMQSIAVPYVIYAITHSTTWLGLSAFVTFAPAVVIGPVSGAIADRFSRRGVLLVTQTVQMVMAFALWGLWVAGWATPGIILVVLLFGSIAAGINITSWQAFVPALVPPDDLLNAVRVNSVQFTAARAVGPALAGVVLARFGPSTAFMVNAVTYLLVIGALLAVRPRRNPLPEPGTSFLRQFRDGAHYVWRRESLRLAVVTILLESSLASALVQLAPAFARDQFHVGKAAYGLLVAAFGTGAIAASISVAAYADRYRRSRATMLGLGGSAVGVVLLAASPIYEVGLVALLIMGTGYVTLTVSLNTSIQVQVDEAFRGRAVSIYLMALMAGLPLGALVLGAAADAVGMRPTVAVAGLALGGYTLFALTRLSGLRAIDARYAEADAR